MERYDSIEGARAFLAWWVVIGHLLGLSGFSPAYYSQLDGLWWDFMFILRNGAIAVWCFMIISGFVITHLLIAKPENYPVYIARRFFRLWPLHIVTLSVCFYLAQTSIMPLHFGSADPGTAFLAESLMLQGLIPNELWGVSSSIINPPDWSISLEWQFYLLAPCIVYGLVRGGNTKIDTDHIGSTATFDWVVGQQKSRDSRSPANVWPSVEPSWIYQVLFNRYRVSVARRLCTFDWQASF